MSWGQTDGLGCPREFQVLQAVCLFNRSGQRSPHSTVLLWECGRVSPRLHPPLELRSELLGPASPEQSRPGHPHCRAGRVLVLEHASPIGRG